jgi:hypothetical protein
MFRIIALVGALVATPAAAGWFSYDSYEDCILDKMKGQTEGSRWTVNKVCSKNDDFEGPIEFVFHDDEASMRMIPIQQNARCMRGIEVWGRYK